MVSVAIVLSLLFYTSFPILLNQKDVLIFAANANGLYDLAISYSDQTSLTYYNQSDIIYSKAKLTNDSEVVRKYSNFLKMVLDSDKKMLNRSKCVLAYNIAKIELLLNNKSEAKEYFKKSIAMNRNLVEQRLKYDLEAKKFISE